MNHDYLTKQEQIEINQSLAESYNYKDSYTKGDDFVLEGGNDTRRLKVNRELTQRKIEAINALKECRASTPPEIVSDLLSQLFENSDTEPGWWLYVAQHWPPNPINRVIKLMLKLHQGKWITFRDPAKYFTSEIKHRKQRMIFQKKRREKHEKA